MKPVRETAVALKGVHDFVLPLYREQESAGGRGSVHSAKHQYGVALACAQRAQTLAAKHDLPPVQTQKIVDLAWLTGITHDLIRNPAEKTKSAKASLVDSDGFATTLSLLHAQRGDSREDERLRTALGHLSKNDLKPVAWAILENERPNSQVAQKLEEAYAKGLVMHAILLDSLTFGDKAVQGTGPVIVKRRAEFVSGERHDNIEDLGEYVHRILSSAEGMKKGISSTEQTRPLVYALESLLRIHGLKPVSGFPPDLREAVNEKREMELDVYYSLLHHLRFRSESELLKFGLKTGYPNLAPNAEKIRSELKAVHSTSKISQVSASKATQAAQMVNAFATKSPLPPGPQITAWESQIAAESKIDPFREIESRFK